jgi:hypothetical protein
MRFDEFMAPAALFEFRIKEDRFLVEMADQGGIDGPLSMVRRIATIGSGGSMPRRSRCTASASRHIRDPSAGRA